MKRNRWTGMLVTTALLVCGAAAAGSAMASNLLASNGGIASTGKLPGAVASLGPSTPEVRPDLIDPGSNSEQVFTGGRSRRVQGITVPLFERNSIHWSSWNSAGARGTGYLWLDQCNPDCAQGSYLRYAVTLTLSRPGLVNRVLIFKRMAVSYSSTVPRGLERDGTFTAGYESGFGWVLRGGDF